MNYGKRAAMARQATLDSKSTKIRKKVGINALRALLVFIVIFGAISISAAFGIWKGIIDSAPDISRFDVTPSDYLTTVVADDGTTQIATLVASGANREYVTIQEVPVHLQHAFVAIEDARFYEHNGIDTQGIARAFLVGIAKIATGKSPSEGASTITQQLIKNNVLTSWTSETSFLEKLQRKIQEQYLAIELEKQVDDKDFILENYMNTINLGAGTLGVQAASEKYFGKDVSELTLSESAVIAGITQNPSRYNPIRYPENNATRRQKVLKCMLDQGYITKAEYDEALADPVYDRIASYNLTNEGSVNSYFVDALINDVRNDLVQKLGWTETEAYRAIYRGGLTIKSTQNVAIQNICDTEVNNPENYSVETSYSFRMSFQIKKKDGTYKSYSSSTMLSYYKAKTGNEDFDINYSSEEECREAIKKYQDELLEEGDEIVEGSESIYITLEPQVAMTIIDQSTGQVKALVGGRGEKEGNRTWNRATNTCRQPGSTFKILGCFAAALDAGGYSLASPQDDAPFTVGTKTFNNTDKTHRGNTTIREMITYSINVPTLMTLYEMGAGMGYEYAQGFGFTTLSDKDRNLSLGLGGLTNGVTNLELTAAYATIANKGDYIKPSFYTEVLDHDGNVLLRKSDYTETREVLKETTAWLLTDAMKDVMTLGTGKKAYFGDSVAVAGKSGTTTSSRDSLFAGYTPYYTGVIWGGFDDNSKQSNTAYTKVLWKNIMGKIHEGLPYKDFSIPAGITSVEVCRDSGLLPVPGVCDHDPRGSRVITEYFALDNVPTEYCTQHVQVNLCKDSGLPATEHCTNTETKIYLKDVNTGSPDEKYKIPADYLLKKCTVHP